MNIAIAHFRVGLTDGVSLEIDKRKAVLESMGHTVSLIAGSHTGPVQVYIPYFEYKNHPTIAKVNELAFMPDKAQELKELMNRVAQEIEMSLEALWTKEKFQALFIHNIFCLAVCLPGSLAFYQFLKKHPDIKGITIHNDFYWEAARAHLFAFTNPYAMEVLELVMPPQLPNLTHTVINTIAQQSLKDKRGIESLVLSDTFDFTIPVQSQNDSNKHFLQDVGLTPKDIIFLTAVRVRERKAIELSIDAVYKASQEKKKYIGKAKHNGQIITEESSVVLLIPGEFTDKEAHYVVKLKDTAKQRGVDIRWIQDLVGSDEQKAEGIKKYSLWDCYVYADAVLYTSIWEGWGNQFMEAIIAKKPIIVFEYPVFSKDIKPVGFSVVSLGSEYTTLENGLVAVNEEKVDAAAQEMLSILTDNKKFEQVVNANYRLGKAITTSISN